jgi:hypothetical protein
MKNVQNYINEKQAGYAMHPFFARLQKNAALREVLPCLPHLAFWAMGFQDAVRLNEEGVVDPVMKRIIRHHRAEEVGHDRWFINDIMKVEGTVPDLRAVFGPHHTAMRDVTYSLMAEVLKANNDYERLLVLFVFESTGQVFLQSIARYFGRMGVNQSLQYFADHHIDAEKGHEVFEEELAKFIAGIELSAEQSEAAKAMVDRAYGAFSRMLDSFEAIALKAEGSNVISLSERRLLAHEASLRAAA